MLICSQYPTTDMFPLVIVLCFIPLFHGGLCDDDCAPSFADTCFTGVSSDLKYMLNLNKMVAINVSIAAVHDLCLAIDDSLNCTSDIIDEDCDKEDGRDRFDSWLRALRGTYSYVCEGSGHTRLRKLLRSIPCWSLEDFIFCCEEQLGLTHIQNLLYTEFSEFECKKLRLATKQCHKEAFVDSCREQEDVETEVKKMISSFFSASRCHGVGLDAGSSEAAKFSFSEFVTIFTLSGIALLLG